MLWDRFKLCYLHLLIDEKMQLVNCISDCVSSSSHHQQLGFCYVLLPGQAIDRVQGCCNLLRKVLRVWLFFLLCTEALICCMESLWTAAFPHICNDSVGKEMGVATCCLQQVQHIDSDKDLRPAATNQMCVRSLWPLAQYISQHCMLSMLG